jgi:uncharacterized protein (DUF2147 family)
MTIKANSLGKTCLGFAVAVSFGFASTAHAGSPEGTWLRPATGGHNEVFSCDGGIGIKVAKSAVADQIGKTIMCGATPDGENKWKGTVNNLDDGQQYTGFVKLDGDNLVLSGCVLGGLLCKDETWSRIK